MKKQLLYLILFFLAFQSLKAQCTRSGSFVQSDPQYSISGDANITFTALGDKDVIFTSNFATVQGADLRVYLSKANDINAVGADAIEIGGPLENDGGGFSGAGTSPITGMMTFTLPTSTEINDFDFIVIQCIVIDERWGYVSLANGTGAGCPALSVDDNTLSSVSIYPNPSRGKFRIEAPTNDTAQLSIFNILGKRVYQKTESLNSEINLDGLRSGIYLLKIATENGQITKRLIIE